MIDDPLRQLIELSNRLGLPANDYAILGEGNTSARIDSRSFWVKASGAELRTADAAAFVRMDTQRVLALLDKPALGDEQTECGLADAKLDVACPVRPSVEAAVHAVCLQLDGVTFVGHTHPTAVNILTCSRAFPEAFRGRLFPDEIVVCGLAPLLVPYVDPGLALARAIQQQLDDYVRQYATRPRVILLQNHGLIALGATPREVEHITAMAAKTARILVGTYALGGPNFLTPAAAERIHGRPDEHYRQRVLGLP